MSLEHARVTNSMVVNGYRYTVLDKYFFLGRDINPVLMKIVLKAMQTKSIVELYEGYAKGFSFNLVNNESTKPITAGVRVNESNVVCISEGYLSNNLNAIDWSLVGAVSVNGEVVWTHPNLNINLRVVKSDSVSKRVPNRKTNPSSKLYKNLTEFKSWLTNKPKMRVVHWKGVRNRTGVILQVVDLVKTRGFHIDAYFGSRRIGSDFLEFQPATCYEFGKDGVVSVLDERTNELLYVLEPVN